MLDSHFFSSTNTYRKVSSPETLDRVGSVTAVDGGNGVPSSGIEAGHQNFTVLRGHFDLFFIGKRLVGRVLEVSRGEEEKGKERKGNKEQKKKETVSIS